MVTNRVCGPVGIALLAAMLVAIPTGTIAPAGSIGSVGLTGPIGAVGAATSGAPSEPASAPSSAAIETGFLQVENGTRIAFEHTGGERASYEVTVSGEIEAGPEADLEDAEFVDRASAGRATGSVAEGGTDDFFFTGEITSLAVDGPITVYVDGEAIDPQEIGDGTTTTDTETAATTTTTTATTTATATATESPTPTTRTTTEAATTTTTATSTATTTATSTATATATETSTPTPTSTETRTATATTTETETAAPTRPRATTPGGGDGGGSTGLGEQERGLFLTIGGVLLLGIVAIGGFALLARR